MLIGSPMSSTLAVYGSSTAKHILCRCRRRTSWIIFVYIPVRTLWRRTIRVSEFYKDGAHEFLQSISARRRLCDHVDSTQTFKTHLSLALLLVVWYFACAGSYVYVDRFCSALLHILCEHIVCVGEHAQKRDCVSMSQNTHCA